MMAGLDSLYHNDLGDAAEQGSYSSFSSPGGTSSLRHRRLDEPFHSSAHASLEDNIESVGQNAGDRIQPIQQVSSSKKPYHFSRSYIACNTQDTKNIVTFSFRSKQTSQRIHEVPSQMWVINMRISH